MDDLWGVAARHLGVWALYVVPIGVFLFLVIRRQFAKLDRRLDVLQQMRSSVTQLGLVDQLEALKATSKLMYEARDLVENATLVSSMEAFVAFAAPIQECAREFTTHLYAAWDPIGIPSAREVAHSFKHLLQDLAYRMDYLTRADVLHATTGGVHTASVPADHKSHMQEAAVRAKRFEDKFRGLHEELRESLDVRRNARPETGR